MAEAIFQFEINTKEYGKLFFRVYPNDEKDNELLNITELAENEIFNALFSKLYKRATKNSISIQNIDTNLLLKKEYDDFLEKFFYIQFNKYPYDIKLSIHENLNNAFKFDNEQFKKTLLKLNKSNVITSTTKEIERMQRNLGFALSGNTFLDALNVREKIFGSNNYLKSITNIINAGTLSNKMPAYMTGEYLLDKNILNVDTFPTLETAIDKIINTNEPFLGNIIDITSPFSKQLDTLSRYKDYGFPYESIELARDYIPDDYTISKISKDIFSDLSFYIKNVDDENDSEYRLNDIKYDKGFIDFIHDIKEKDVIRFLTHLQDFPYLALLDDLGKRIFQSVQNEIAKYTIIVKDQIFYRARAKEENTRNYTPNEIGQPQYGVPGMGRFNFLGKPYYYVTSDEETAKKEVQTSNKPESTVMKLKQIKEMKVFDISTETCPLVTYCSFDKEEGNDYTSYLVPNFLSVCCAYLNKKNRHSVDAIKYKSVKNKDGFCYVILDKSYADFFDDGEIVGI